MFLKRLGLAGLVIGLGFGAAGCTDGYGYSGVGVGYASGYGNGYYDDGYGYGGVGYGGYGASAFGWYGDYYYPGSGGYVYDRYRRPYRWNDGQRRYWEGRRGNYRGDRNWNGFDRGIGADGVRGNRNFYRGDGDRSAYRNRGQPGVRTPGTTTQGFTPRGQGRVQGNSNGRTWRGSRERR